jgi:hypothetical protein
MSTATAPAIIEAAPSDIQSQQRLMRVKELWTRSQKDQLEIGRLLYEERAARLAVGGRGVHEGFHQWLRDADISKASAYRRIAEYEISIGVRAREEKRVSSETTFKNADIVQAEHVTSSDKMAYRTDLSAPTSQQQCKPVLDEGQRWLAEWRKTHPLKTGYTYDEHQKWYETCLKDYLQDGPKPKIVPVNDEAEAGAFTDARGPVASGGLGVRTINGRWHLPHQVPAVEPVLSEDEVKTLALRVIDAGFEALKDSVDPSHLHAATRLAKQSLRTKQFMN